MKQNIKDIKVFHNFSSLWSEFLDSNPQLFRELKGRLKTRNVVVAAAISLIAQFVMVISFLSQLPDSDPIDSPQRSFWCYGNNLSNDTLACTKDLVGNWVVNWQLLWLYLFMTISVTAILSLLMIGTYVLITDVVKEEERGTLNFIRLSPQSAGNILLGKILGAPILLYIAVGLMLPLHFLAGLNAHIPFGLILVFDAVVIAGCGFFYSLALLWSLTNTGLSGFKPWLATGMLGFLLFITTQALFDGGMNMNHPFAWPLLFNPAIVLSYLTETTFLPQDKIDFLSAENLGDLLFYGQACMTKASIGIGFILGNLSLWTYWCWSLLKRRFHNPEYTLISKTQSYWFTSWFVILALGFTLQNNVNFPLAESLLSNSFTFLQFYLCILELGLIAALSPHRQALQDWARYRHQTSKNGNILWRELIFGENSPATVAIAINFAIAITYITPSIFLILDQDKKYIFWGFILSAGSVLLCAMVAQLILATKNRKRAAWSVMAVASMIIVPPLSLGVADITPDVLPQVWLFSFVPVVATSYASTSMVLLTILGQWVGISLLGFQLTRKLKQAGASESTLLFSQSR